MEIPTKSWIVHVPLVDLITHWLTPIMVMFCGWEAQITLSSCPQNHISWENPPSSL